MVAQTVKPFRIGSIVRDDAGAAGVITSINPADGSIAGQVVRATPEDVDTAVSVAWDAFRNKPWRRLRPDQRATVLYEIGRRISAERDRLAHLQMLDSGKPLKECINMVNAAAGHFRYYAAVCETWQDEVTSPRGEYFSMALAEPYGVVACITPWNSPIMNEAQKAAPALAAGNAVLIKPSEETPQLALELVRICTEAGLPEGLLIALPGLGEDVGAALVKHPGVRMVSFTGGTETGRAIGAIAGKRLIPVGLELGGKSPHIVFDDADLDRAVAGVMSGIFGSAGQSCVAGSRLFVQKSVYGKVLDALVERSKGLRVRLPDDPEVQMGPLVSAGHRQKVADCVDLARSEGGQVLVGGYAPQEQPLDQGMFYIGLKKYKNVLMPEGVGVGVGLGFAGGGSKTTKSDKIRISAAARLKAAKSSGVLNTNPDLTAFSMELIVLSVTFFSFSAFFKSANFEKSLI